MKLSDKGEFGLIKDISTQYSVPEGVTGIGDDCAIIPQTDGQDTLVSTDMLIEGTHFLIKDITPWQLGWKSAAVNLSDIAAMGGTLTGTFLSVALPQSLEVSWVESFMEGYKAISSEYGVPLLGGDTTSSLDRLCINVTVLGQCPHGQALRRDSAKLGDLVCVTGPLGDSAGGLKAILDSVPMDADIEHLIECHYLPRPCVEQGIKLRQCPGVHAAMDISDGIASDLLHILEASGVGARIDISRLPISDCLRRVCASHEWDVMTLAVEGGEDYQLLFTMAPDACPDLQFQVIGEIVQGTEVEWIGGKDKYMGFRHF